MKPKTLNTRIIDDSSRWYDFLSRNDLHDRYKSILHSADPPLIELKNARKYFLKDFTPFERCYLGVDDE